MKNMTQKIVPRGARVLVKRDEAKGGVSEHGIVTPDSVEKEQKAYGTVVAVGSDIKDVKVGDRCVYGAYAGEDIEQEENGKKVEYKLLDSEDVIAFLK